MPYPSSHFYLTVHWQDTREPDEGGQFGLRFDSPAVEVTQAQVDACLGTVQTFWQAAGTSMPAPYLLTHLRLALIAENGQYVPGTFSRDGSMGAGVSVPANTANPMPLQVASVVTLLTDAPSGQASRGRCFLPPLAAALQTTGRWTTQAVDARATTFATMINGLNQQLVATPGGIKSAAAVYSKGTIKNAAGARRLINGVKIGTKPDVQRRRAKSMQELYGATKVVTIPVP